MTRSRVYRTDAIVLKRTSMNEADRLLTVYTPERGKLRLMAKGTRKVASRRAGHVELFTLTHLQVAKGRTWDIVAQAEMVDAFAELRSELIRTSYAYYVAELIDRFVEDEVENRPLFELLRSTMEWLGVAPDPALAVRHFELRLLSLSGYQPQLFHCLNCGEPLQPVVNLFSISDGGVFCPRCGELRPGAEPISLNNLKLLRFLQAHEFEACSGLTVSPALHAEAENLLQRYIIYVLERTLKSINFVRVVRSEAA